MDKSEKAALQRKSRDLQRQLEETVLQSDRERELLVQAEIDALKEKLKDLGESPISQKENLQSLDSTATAAAQSKLAATVQNAQKLDRRVRWGRIGMRGVNDILPGHTSSSGASCYSQMAPISSKTRHHLVDGSL